MGKILDSVLNLGIFHKCIEPPALYGQSEVPVSYLTLAMAVMERYRSAVPCGIARLGLLVPCPFVK